MYCTIIALGLNIMNIKDAGTFAESGSIAHLTKLLINDPKLEVVAYHMFIESDNKS